MMKKLWAFLILLSAAISPAFSDDNFFLIHDFNSQDYANRLGGPTGKWELDPNDTSQWCNISFSPENAIFMEQGYSLRIEYNITSSRQNFVTGNQGMSQQEVGQHAKNFNGIYMLLKGFDATPFKYLTFWAKGDAAEGYPRNLKIELKDKARSSQVTVDGLTEHWQVFYVPLSRFGSDIKLSELMEFVIVFDEKSSRPKGVVYLDQVGLSKDQEIKSAPGGLESVKIPQIKAPPVKDAVIIDGKLDEWSGECFDLGEKNLEFGQYHGKKDGSAKVCLAWDSVYLYIGAKVKDDQIVNTKSGSEIYRMDGLELFFDPQNNGLEWKNVSDFQLGIAPGSSEGLAQVWSYFDNRKPAERDVKTAVTVTKSGYVIESAVSFKFLGINPVANEVFGFSAALHDLDPKDAHDYKLNWHFAKDAKDQNLFRLGIVKLSE